MTAAEVPSLVLDYDAGIDIGDRVNVEVDLEPEEAAIVLGFMDKYSLTSYADALRLMAMMGAGAAVADPDGTSIRMVLRGLAVAIAVLTGMWLDDYTGW